MKDLIAGLIYINADDSMMRIGPFIFDDPLNDSFIKNKIHESLLKNGLAYYTTEDIEDIVVIAAGEGFECIYSPKIEDVWPRDFGPIGFNRYVTKRGDK